MTYLERYLQRCPFCVHEKRFMYQSFRERYVYCALTKNKEWTSRFWHETCDHWKPKERRSP